MGDALGYRCHPCTPYKRREHGDTPVPNTENISPNGVSPEESLIVCRGVEHSYADVQNTTTSSVLILPGIL